MEEVAEAVQKAMCTAFMLGDKLLNERPLMPSWDVASHSASMPRRRVFFDKMKMNRINLCLKRIQNPVNCFQLPGFFVSSTCCI